MYAAQVLCSAVLRPATDLVHPAPTSPPVALHWPPLGNAIVVVTKMSANSLSSRLPIVVLWQLCDKIEFMIQAADTPIKCHLILACTLTSNKQKNSVLNFKSVSVALIRLRSRISNTDA